MTLDDAAFLRSIAANLGGTSPDLLADDRRRLYDMANRVEAALAAAMVTAARAAPAPADAGVFDAPEQGDEFRHLVVRWFDLRTTVHHVTTPALADNLCEWLRRGGFRVVRVGQATDPCYEPRPERAGAAPPQAPQAEAGDA